MDKLFLRLNHRETNKDPNCPVLVLSVQAYRKLMFWTKYASEVNKWEVSGLGTVQPRHGGYFVSNVWLIKPEAVGAAHADMDGHGVASLMQKLFYGTGEMRETTGDNVSYVGGRDLKNLRFLWHSHNNFGVGWSGTDNRTAKLEFCQDAKWTINLNLNAMGHMIARMDFPVKNHKLLVKAKAENKGSMKDTTIYELPIRLLVPIAKSQVESYRAEYVETHELKMRSFATGLGSKMSGIPFQTSDSEEINGDADIDADDLAAEEPYVEKPLVIPPSPGFQEDTPAVDLDEVRKRRYETSPTGRTQSEPQPPLQNIPIHSEGAPAIRQAMGIGGYDSVPTIDFKDLKEKKYDLLKPGPPLNDPTIITRDSEPNEFSLRVESIPDPIPDGLSAVNLFDEVGVAKEEESAVFPAPISSEVGKDKKRSEPCTHPNFRQSSTSYSEAPSLLQRLSPFHKLPSPDQETGWCPDCRRQINRMIAPTVSPPS